MLQNMMQMFDLHKRDTAAEIQKLTMHKAKLLETLGEVSNTSDTLVILDDAFFETDDELIRSRRNDFSYDRNQFHNLENQKVVIVNISGKNSITQRRAKRIAALKNGVEYVEEDEETQGPQEATESATSDTDDLSNPEEEVPQEEETVENVTPPGRRFMMDNETQTDRDMEQLESDMMIRKCNTIAEVYSTLMSIADEAVEHVTQQYKLQLMDVEGKYKQLKRNHIHLKKKTKVFISSLIQAAKEDVMA